MSTDLTRNKTKHWPKAKLTLLLIHKEIFKFGMFLLFTINYLSFNIKKLHSSPIAPCIVNTRSVTLPCFNFQTFVLLSHAVIHCTLKQQILCEKYPNTEISLVRIRIFSYSVQIRENTDQKKLRIWTLFTQWKFSKFSKTSNNCKLLSSQSSAVTATVSLFWLINNFHQAWIDFPLIRFVWSHPLNVWNLN